MGLWDKFRSDKKSGRYLGTGTKIRRIRSQKDTTVVELANALGVNEAAIRNYEIGYRQASRDKLELIAQRLGVPVETLIDRQIDSYNDAIHILFELSEKYDLVPIELPQEHKYAIQTKDETILQALQAWYNERRKWENGDITQAELQEWTDTFPLQCEENEPPAEKVESRYTDFERILGLKSSLEQFDMIVNDNVELIEDCIAHKDYKTAREHLRTLKATVHTLSQVDIKRYGK